MPHRTARHRQPGVSEEGAEGTAPGGPRPRRAARGAAEEAHRAGGRRRKPFTLQARQTAGGLQLTPDEKYVIVSVFETAATPAKNTIVPNFVTDSAYTEDIPGRTNVGDSQGTSRLAIVNVETGEVKWVDHGQKKPPRPRERPTARVARSR